MNQIFKQGVIAFFLIFAATPVFALGKISRACNFADLDSSLQTPALILFAYLGMPSKYLEIRNQSEEEKRLHWILESITTDYGSSRYYLFAENKVYRQDSNGQDKLFREYRSPWASQSLDPAIFPDSRLSVFKFNRKVLFSSRAGNPEFVERIPLVEARYKDWFVVIGQHYYYDPVSKSLGYLGRTRITDCDLGNVGIEDR